MKNRKTYAGIFVSLCCCLFFLACVKEDKNIKIALMLGDMKAARWQKDKEYFLKETERLGCEGIVVDANSNEALQFKQAKELIEQGVKSLIIAAVNSNSGAAIVRLANKKGVKTIAYDGTINNCLLDYIVSFEDREIGILMAKHAISIAKSGNYVIIGGDRSNKNSIQIREGEEEILMPYIKNGEIKISYATYVEGWNREEAYMVMKKYIRLSSGDRPTAVLGSNDNIADGIIQACEEENIPLPVITGQDASLIGCRNVMKGKQLITVYKPLKKLASLAAEVALKAARKEKIEVSNSTVFNGLTNVPIVFVDIIAVDQKNMKTTVIADDFQKKEDILK